MNQIFSLIKTTENAKQTILDVFLQVDDTNKEAVILMKEE